MTIAQRIIAELSSNPNGLTHNDLASRLNLNEPSVRRTVQTLRASQLVTFARYADASGRDMLFTLSR